MAYPINIIKYQTNKKKMFFSSFNWKKNYFGFINVYYYNIIIIIREKLHYIPNNLFKKLFVNLEKKSDPNDNL